jgi:hypothetical protein
MAVPSRAHALNLWRFTLLQQPVPRLPQVPPPPLQPSSTVAARWDAGLAVRAACGLHHPCDVIVHTAAGAHWNARVAGHAV